MTMMRHLLYPVPSNACDIQITTAVFPSPGCLRYIADGIPRRTKRRPAALSGDEAYGIMTEVVAVVCLERREGSDDEHQ